jgi:hypothetical protein
MKPTKTLMCAVLMCLTSGAVAAPDFVAFHVPSTYKQRYELKVMQSALDAAPMWREDQPNPPLAARQAIGMAKEKLVKMHPESANWNLRTVNLTKLDAKGQWIYCIRFEVPERSPHMIPTPFDMIVLMDGTVVEPVTRNFMREMTRYFGFDGASVRLVLQYYSDLTGKEVVIESEAVENAPPLTVSVRTLEKNEAIKLLEGELQRQAGVLLVPGEGGQMKAKLDAK